MVIHYSTKMAGKAACGNRRAYDAVPASHRHLVDCKRCLAKMARMDEIAAKRAAREAAAK